MRIKYSWKNNMEAKSDLYELFKDYTMIPRDIYVRNLELVDKYKHVDGAIVECGTWRGGMIAGIAKMLSDENRSFYLFDSFQGLPEVQKIDGQRAKDWQADKESPSYYDNCTAEKRYAEKAMEISGARNFSIIEGWFEKTLPNFKQEERIAILRLDADWYKSTTQCFEYLYDKIAEGGIIIIDDYYVWDGCTRAVHDFLSGRKLSDKIRQYDNDICYIVKEGISAELD